MNLAAIGAILAVSTVPARAETSFDEYSEDVSRRPAQQLAEAGCDLDIQVRGAIATFEARHRIVNPGPGALGSSYAFDLPRGATLTGFSLRAGTTVEQALPIAGEITVVDGEARPMFGIDPALVEALPPGSASQYVLRVQPLAEDREVTITLRYTAIAELRGGALRLVIPGRPNTSKLSACRGSIRAVGGPGATVGAIRVAGTEAGTRGVGTFTVDTKDVVVDAELAFAGVVPVVWTQSEALADGWTATVVTVAAPPIRTTTPRLRRALFVVDGSRSMELVGRQNTTAVIRKIAATLPVDTAIEAIIYDRTAKRVLGTWKPGDAATLAAIEKEITTRAAINGSDLVGAFKLAHTAISDNTRDTTMVIVISDGVLGDVDGMELTKALDAKTSTVDVLAVVLDPASTQSPGAAALRSPVNLHGGSFVEVGVSELDSALGTVDEWLRPAWLELSLGDRIEIPETVRAGSGFTRMMLHRGAAPKLVLTGHGETPIKIAARGASRAPIATLVLADPELAERFVVAPDPTDADIARGARARASSLALHPYVHEGLAFALLSTSGKVAKNRIAVVKAGGPYERIVDVFDPPVPPVVTIGTTTLQPSAIARITLERLFRDQLQPKAYACYQRALGLAPKLAGTVHFDFRMGRGEVTSVAVAGLGDAQMDTCLLDAAYQLTLPLPDFTVNADDQTVARYPLTFVLSESRPQVVLGDADSTSPLDIDAIQGGVPGKRGPVKVDSATPLGTMRPSKSP